MVAIAREGMTGQVKLGGYDGEQKSYNIRNSILIYTTGRHRHIRSQSYHGCRRAKAF